MVSIEAIKFEKARVCIRGISGEVRAKNMGAWQANMLNFLSKMNMHELLASWSRFPNDH